MKLCYVVVLAILWVGAFSTPAFSQDTTLKLVYPRGGEVLYTSRDSIVEIRWTGINDTLKVRLDYSTDNLRNWVVIADSVLGGTYSWNVARLTPSTSYRVRVAQVRPPASEDNVVYRGHSSPVVDAWWSPSFDQIVSAAAEVHVWDATRSSSTPITALPLPRSTYTSVRWSRDSSRIAVGDEDNQATVVNAISNTVASTFTNPSTISGVEFDTSSQWLFTRCDDNRVRVYNLPNTLPRATHNAGSTLEDMVVSPDGTRVLLCANEARVYPRVPGLPLAFSGHSVGVIGGAWSPTGNTICTIGGDATIRLWNSTTGVQIWSANDPREGVRSISFSQDGLFVAVGLSDSSVVVINAVTGTIINTFRGYKGAVRMVAFSPDGLLVAGASDDNTARIHEPSTDRTLFTLNHNNDVFVVRWNDLGDKLLTSSRDGTARVWQISQVTLQADTSGAFAIAPPPPAFARFTATGDTLNIEEETVITVSLEGAQFLDLAGIDSVRFRCTFDPSMLQRLQSSLPVKQFIDEIYSDTQGARRSRQIVEFESILLPQNNQSLFTIRFRATLGQDTISALSMIRVDQIGNGPGIRIDTHSEPILVRGVCRESGTPRLYTSLGTPLSIENRPASGGVRLIFNLAEQGHTTLAGYDLLGRLVWTDSATRDEELARVCERFIPSVLFSGPLLVVVTSPTESLSQMVVQVTR